METHRRITTKMYNVINGYVTGQLTVSAIGAGFAGLTVFVLSLFIAEVPSNLAFPTIAIVFTLSLIPMFGATIAGVIVSLLLLANNPLAAIIFAIYFVVYQQIENNFISPAIQSKRLELSPLIVLVAVTIGTYVFGLAGGIISIPIAGCIKVLLDDYLENNQKRRAAEEKPLAKLVKKIKNSVAEA
jgi:predicted PurR-regulated permease PerM